MRLFYEAVRSFISSIMTSGKTTQDKEIEFLIGTRGAKWLFGDEIAQYIDKQLWEKVCDLGCLQSELTGLGVGEERSRNVHTQADIKKWLLSQLEVIDAMFFPYLSLRH
jgi:hypothetical protein